MTSDIPFAVVDDVYLPCCCLLGTNFLENCNVNIDYFNDSVTFVYNREMFKYAMCNNSRSDNRPYNLNVMCSIVAIDDSTSSDEHESGDDFDDVEDEPEMTTPKVRFVLGMQRKYCGFTE